MLGLLSIVISIFCVGTVIVLCKRNEKLIEETRVSKQGYLSTKSNMFILEDDYHEMRRTLQDTFKLNKELKVLNVELHTELNECRSVIAEQREVISTYKSDMDKIKKKLNLYDEVAPHCKLVTNIKTTL